jgi:hypothetical protein
LQSVDIHNTFAASDNHQTSTVINVVLNISEFLLIHFQMSQTEQKAPKRQRKPADRGVFVDSDNISDDDEDGAIVWGLNKASSANGQSASSSAAAADGKDAKDDAKHTQKNKETKSEVKERERKAKQREKEEADIKAGWSRGHASGSSVPDFKGRAELNFEVDDDWDEVDWMRQTLTDEMREQIVKYTNKALDREHQLVLSEYHRKLRDWNARGGPQSTPKQPKPKQASGGDGEFLLLSVG